APRSATTPVRPTVPSVKSFIGDLTKAAGDYLGMDLKTLVTQLRGGKSLADLANALSAQGKSASGLIDTLTKAADAKVDQAVAAKKLTPEQAASLKPKLGAIVGGPGVERTRRGTELALDRVLDQRYRIVEPIGAGGSSQVYLAQDTALGREVAIKILDPHAAADTTLRKLFVKEARALA